MTNVSEIIAERLKDQLRLKSRLLRNLYLTLGPSWQTESDEMNRINALNEVDTDRVYLDSDNNFRGINMSYLFPTWMDDNKDLYSLYSGYSLASDLRFRKGSFNAFRDQIKKRIDKSPYFSEERKILKEHLKEMENTPYDNTKVKK
ncbi:MAG: hypothetical protein WCK29_03640 [archaeon]